MKQICYGLSALLLVTPALAQPSPPPPSGEQALDIQLRHEIDAHHSDLTAAIDRINALTKEITALTKQRDDLQVQLNAAAHPAPAPATEPSK